MNRTAEPFIPTLSGRAVYPGAPMPEDFNCNDLAETLAKVNRVNGHTITPFSVAQHSCNVHDLVTGELARAYALLHDGHEYVMGDLTAPFRAALSEAANIELDAMAWRIDQAIFEAAGLQHPMPGDVQTMVKHADRVAFATEHRDLMGSGRVWDEDLPGPASTPIKPWPWPRAADAFMDRAKNLAAGGIIKAEFLAR